MLGAGVADRSKHLWVRVGLTAVGLLALAIVAGAGPLAPHRRVSLTG